MKDTLTAIVVMTLPERSNGFIVYCDASKIRPGCVLIQNGKLIDYVLW